MARRTIPRLRKPVVASRFTRKLLAWFRRHARDLPWRRTRDPYRVLVSEFMLQQTQVSRVEQYYPGFLKHFPTVERLAQARPQAVREQWEGLGYYARARNLHQLAKTVVRRHHATVPSDPDALVELPGVGRYTAGAVASFAYEKPVAAVDTNVARVLRRVFIGEWGVGSGTRRGRAEARTATARTTPRLPRLSSKLWDLASTLVPSNGQRAWSFNQALMELGATVCKARTPKCPECPVRNECKTGRRRGPGRGG
ncbi:MAG: A/G-specific adenine glycosylase [Gemmatimonadales bacterium]